MVSKRNSGNVSMLDSVCTELILGQRWYFLYNHPWLKFSGLGFDFRFQIPDSPAPIWLSLVVSLVSSQAESAAMRTRQTFWPLNSLSPWSIVCWMCAKQHFNLSKSQVPLCVFTFAWAEVLFYCSLRGNNLSPFYTYSYPNIIAALIFSVIVCAVWKHNRVSFG